MLSLIFLRRLEDGALAYLRRSTPPLPWKVPSSPGGSRLMEHVICQVILMQTEGRIAASAAIIARSNRLSAAPPAKASLPLDDFIAFACATTAHAQLPKQPPGREVLAFLSR